MSHFELKHNILDETTPPNVPLRACYKRSFAYYIIRERLPNILTQVIDQLSKDSYSIIADLGEKGVRDDLLDIQDKILKLKIEMETDKKFTKLTGTEVDKEQWNAFLGTLTDDNNSYFTSTWLYTECYMYRRLKSIFEQSMYMVNFDYFGKQKRNALYASQETMIFVAEHVKKAFAPNITPISDEQLWKSFFQLLKLSLWGNRCDLSISAGKEFKQTGNPFLVIDSLDEFILIDRSQDAWQLIRSLSNDSTIDFVLDNAGYELFTDFVLANFMLEHGLAARVRFHLKPYSWFVSDVTPQDFHWAIAQLWRNPNAAISELGVKLAAHLADGRFLVCADDYFWAAPYEYARMADVQPELYRLLGESDLIVFKGDLNYRKLMGDFNWPFDTSFKRALRGFQPSNVCSLRTVKADVICELKDGVAEALKKVNPAWMESGEYGIIQFLAQD